MTPLERLLLEEIPTGSFGGTRPAHHTATPPQIAAHHRQELEAALDSYDRERRHNSDDRPNLHAVPDRSQAA